MHHLIVSRTFFRVGLCTVQATQYAHAVNTQYCIQVDGKTLATQISYPSASDCMTAISRSGMQHGLLHEARCRAMESLQEVC